jgi:Flp pilus assembly pilin Flp
MSDFLFAVQYHAGNARAFARRLREDAGQTAAEYMGVLLVVSVIIAAVSQTGIGDTIRTKMDAIVTKVATGDTDATNAKSTKSNDNKHGGHNNGNNGGH